MDLLYYIPSLRNCSPTDPRGKTYKKKEGQKSDHAVSGKWLLESLRSILFLTWSYTPSLGFPIQSLSPLCLDTHIIQDSFLEIPNFVEYMQKLIKKNF